MSCDTAFCHVVVGKSLIENFKGNGTVLQDSEPEVEILRVRQ